MLHLAIGRLHRRLHWSTSRLIGERTDLNNKRVSDERADLPTKVRSERTGPQGITIALSATASAADNHDRGQYLAVAVLPTVAETTFDSGRTDLRLMMHLAVAMNLGKLDDVL